MSGEDVSVEIFEAPLAAALRQELVELWSGVFGTSFEDRAEVLSGSEADDNADVIFLVRSGGDVVATCGLTMGRADPRLGGLGEVATRNFHRGRGLAGVLVERAVGEFCRRGGSYLLLGTINPAAARLYEKFGFSYLPRTRVMVRATDQASEQRFFADWFSGPSDGRCRIVDGSSRHRLPIIPLVLSATSSRILDVNVGLVSTAVAEQVSCMGLYPRFEAIGRSGSWYAAERPDGGVAGLASVLPVAPDLLRLDAFVHPEAEPGTLDRLIAHAAHRAGLRRLALEAWCHEADDAKRAALLGAGFVRRGMTTVDIGAARFPVARFRLEPLPLDLQPISDASGGRF